MHPHVVIKNDLNEFHALYDGVDPEKKLEGLREIQTRHYEFKSHLPLAIRRANFEKHKRHKRYFRMPCYLCGSRCEHRHHIISLKQGGQSSKKNLIPLCRPCHIKIHPWLAEKKVGSIGGFKSV